MEERKQRGYWDNKDNCRLAALDCKTQSEFKSKYYMAWSNCRKNNWVDELCSHFITKQKQRGYWDSEERCREVALLCSTKTEFEKKYPQAYRVSHKNGWDKDYTWFPSKSYLIFDHHGRRKWTYDTTYNEALKYKTRTEFQKGNLGAYSAARRKGWIKDYLWMEEGRIAKAKELIDNVYAYEFPEFNSVYVGRTIDIARRDNEHRSTFRKDINDIVYNFAQTHSIEVPSIKILEENITITDGVKLEGEWVDAYSASGWTILNRKETGGIGSLAFGKWNRTTCYEEAQKFRTRKEFRLKSSSAYKRAWKCGWLDDYTWFINGRKKENWFVWNN